MRLRHNIYPGGSLGFIVYELGSRAGDGGGTRGNQGGYQGGSGGSAEGSGADHNGANNHVGVSHGGFRLDFSLGMYRFVTAAKIGPLVFFDFLLDNLHRVYRDYYRDLHYAGPAHQMVDDIRISAVSGLFRIGVSVFTP